MKNTAYKSALFCGVMALSWLLLSFYFFPIKDNPKSFPTFYAFFLAAVQHIAAIKWIISLIFSIFALFVAELHAEKRKKRQKATAGKAEKSEPAKDRTSLEHFSA